MLVDSTAAVTTITMMPALPYCIRFSEGFLIVGVRMYDQLPVIPGRSVQSTAFALLDILLAKWNFTTCAVTDRRGAIHQHARWLLPEPVAMDIMVQSGPNYQFLIYNKPTDVKA